MGPRGLPGLRRCGLCALLGALLCGLRPAAAVPVAGNDEKRSASPVTATQCWQVDDYVVVQECAPCSSFQLKSMSECRPTGFVEKITCSNSKKDDFKRCRSAATEARVFWRFVGTAMAVAAVFAVLVVCRQRVLDRRALEKVRKQIESI